MLGDWGLRASNILTIEFIADCCKGAELDGVWERLRWRWTDTCKKKLAKWRRLDFAGCSSKDGEMELKREKVNQNLNIDALEFNHKCQMRSL